MTYPRTAPSLWQLLLFGLAFALPQLAADRPAAKKAHTAAGAAKKAGETFGYNTVFEEEVRQIGQITAQQFVERYEGKTTYLPKISWDPTTAKYYDRINRDPQKITGDEPKRPPLGPQYDFRLTAQEQKVFAKNGFVVSERLGDQDCAALFYRIYTRDVPVFLSADALLHAWHRTFDAILEETEENYLAPSLANILTAMASALPVCHQQYGQGVLGECLLDADYFLAVARSLLDGKSVKTQLAQEERVAQTLKACQAQELLRFELFGRPRDVDFSQFKARGHYENTEALKHYFQAMMWCGRIDLRVAGNREESSPRELGAAVVLHDLLRRSGKFEQWEQFDRLLQMLVGVTDSMTFAQLDAVLGKAQIRSGADVKNLDTLAALQADIEAGKIGVQQIRSHLYINHDPFGPAKVVLPNSFTVLGQKFALDSWVTAKVVYDDIIWNEQKVARRVPSCADVAFAALGNDAIIPDLAARMTDTAGHRFRDGLNYQHNLAAVRNVIDRQDSKVWDGSLYLQWLACLRELSRPTTEDKYPSAMRTKAWAMKTLSTQLASWTQLRHDTVLYVKQSATSVPACSYPAGYVEPIPHFWERFERMATSAAGLIEKTPFPDYLAEQRVFTGLQGDQMQFKTDRVLRRGKETQEKQAAFLRNFAKQLTILKEIARKELAEQALTPAETLFLQEVVQLTKHGSGTARYGGWYPGLFYKGRTDSAQWDAIVTDVHTDFPSDLDNDPGCVLHQGVGNVDLLVLAVDNGTDRMVYAGPVLSHYEFEMPGMARKSDRDWRQELRQGKRPPRPAWTNGYLVPGENQATRFYVNSAD